MAEARHRAKHRESLLDRGRRLVDAAIRIGNAAIHGMLDWVSPPPDVDERGVPRYDNSWLPPRYSTRPSAPAESPFQAEDRLRRERQIVGDRINGLTSSALDVLSPRCDRYQIRNTGVPTLEGERATLEDPPQGYLSADPILTFYNRVDGSNHVLRTTYRPIVADGVQVMTEIGQLYPVNGRDMSDGVQFRSQQALNVLWAGQPELERVEQLLTPVVERQPDFARV